MKKSLVLTLAALAPAACASNPRVQHERGWIGGQFVDVTREGPPWTGVVVGMPESAAGDSGALVTAASPGSPIAAAGVAPGDLVLSMDDRPVEGWLDLRERIEAVAPGTHAKLAFWRAGETRAADVVVGRETYESAGTITIGLGFSSTLDLWPFDDGIDVLGLVSVHWDHARNDLDGPVTAYRRALDPDETITGPQQESFGVFVIPIGGSKGKRVVRQETLP